MTAPVPRIGERSSWERVLAALEARDLVTRHRGDHVDARCPAHDDGRASLTADYQPGDPGRVLVCCHAGCEFGAIVAALGLAEADTFDGPPQRDRPHIPRPRRSSPGREPQPAPPTRPKCRHRWVEVDVYEYRDRGELVLEVVRQRCERCGDKNFPVRSPDGRGGMAWAWPDHRPLYRADAVREAVADGRTVYVVEGEKDVHAAESLGEVATTNPGGAGKWRPAHSAMLAGAARVIIVCDRDAVDRKSGYRPGYRHAKAIADALSAGVGELLVVEPGAGKDLSDHLAAGKALAELAEVPAPRLAELAARADPAARLAELDRPPVVAELAARRGGGSGGWGPPGDDDDQDDGEPEPPVGAELVEGSPGWAYMPPTDTYPGAVMKLTGSGKRRGWTHVVGWAPDARARLVTEADDGQPTGRHFELKVGDDTAIVSNADLRTGEWADKFPDATGLGAKQVREVMHNVVAVQARRLPRTIAATRTGWHGSEAERCYVWPDGRTFPGGRRIRLINMPVALAEAARPRGEATDDEIRRALADIVKHGRQAVLGLGCGARSFGQSLRPVPAGLAPWGDPNAGKTLLGWLGRSLAITSKGGRVAGFPPLPTKSFSATATVLELAANLEADLPTLFEDLALPADAAAVEVRDANRKVEALLRSVANADEIRGRATRSDAGGPLIAAPANYVRSIPLLTAERMPPVMMASLYRRAMVPRLYLGQIDTAWFASNSAELLTPLRTIGARVVELLYELGSDAAERLDKYTAAALAELSRAIGSASWVTDVPAMAGVIDASAAILGGLHMVAEVVPGIDAAELTASAIGYLTTALAEQADVIADRGSHAGSLSDAVAEILTRALLDRRAHVCDRDGRPAPLVPGLALSEQGLRDVGRQAPELEGLGVPLYWLPDRSGVGVRSEALHGLLTGYREPRAAGLTRRSLPDALLRDGASLLNTTQKGRSATHLIPSVGAWLILLRPELLAGSGEREPISLSRNSDSIDKNNKNDNLAGQSLVDDLQAGNGEKNDNLAGHRVAELAEPAEPAEPAEAVTSGVIDAPASPASRVEVGTRPHYVTASGRFAAPALVADVDGGYLARPDRVEALDMPRPMDHLAHAVGWAVTLPLGLAHPAGMPDDPVLVILPGLAAALGLPVSAPARGSKAAREHPALGPLREAGWQVTELASTMRVWRPGGRTVRVWLPGWDDFGECPMWGDGVDAFTLAWRLGEFADVLGIGWRLTGGITGTDLADKFPRRGGRKVLACVPPKPALSGALGHAIHWSRGPMPSEAGLGYVHCYDGNGAYLAAYNTPVNLGGWRHVAAPAFDPKLPGYWLIDPPEWGDALLPDLFDPTGRAAATGHAGPRWYQTATLVLVAELGYEIRPREAWLPDGEHGRWYEPWYRRVREARSVLLAAADADSAAVLNALKLVWHATHSQVGTKSQGNRRDHDQAIIAAYAANLTRRMVKVGELAQRWPLAVGTDAVAYASDDPDPITACPAGMALGAGLGEFKVQGTLPMADSLPLLGTGRSGDVNKLFDLAAQWAAQREGGRGDGS